MTELPPVEQEHAADGLCRLWMDVLEWAIKDYLGQTQREDFGREPSGRYLTTAEDWAVLQRWLPVEAGKWLAGTEMTPGSFAWVCEALGLDSDEIRATVYRRKQKYENF